MLWERTEEQGWAGLSCCVLVAAAGWLTSPSVGPSPTPRPPPQPSSPQLSLAERVCLLERTCYLGGLNAESIQLRHPPLHLTFQGTRISRLRCQTFSTCFFFFFFCFGPWCRFLRCFRRMGWGRTGSTKVDAKMERWGWDSGHWTAIHVWRHRLWVLPTTTQWAEVSKSVQWSKEKKSAVGTLLQVITYERFF